MRTRTSLNCILNIIREDYTIDLPANVIPEEAIEGQEVQINRRRREDGVWTSDRAFCLTYVKLPNGKFAYPVYEDTKIIDDYGDSNEGYYCLKGWCVKDTEVFQEKLGSKLYFGSY